MMSYIYKIASTEQEMKQIYELNYKTFVEEIPQHCPNVHRRLIDKYDSENTYLIGLHKNKLAAMLALRDRRPFSMDAKIADFEQYIPFQQEHMFEIRLLAIDPVYRGTRMLSGLLRYLDRFIRMSGYDAGIISGTVRELKLYAHLGFVPFGPLVGTEEAAYQPMYITPASFRQSEAYPLLAQDVRFLAGPVDIAGEVIEAFSRRPAPHRSREFARLHADTARCLCRMTGAQAVQIALGSGTLANDMVAGQLKRLGGRGLVVVNGEFGRRLTDHARRWELPFDAVQAPYGTPVDLAGLRATLTEAAVPYCWVWAVHGETSTGVLNDLEPLKQLAAEAGLYLAVDCVSSLGAVPLNLDGVDFATGVSGKALGSYTGLCFVFHNRELLPSAATLPAYLDTVLYNECGGVPFSHSSNLIAALHAALREYDTADPFERIRRQYCLLRAGVEQIGLPVLADPQCEAPYILTIPLPPDINSGQLGDKMYDQGFELQYESGYLLDRNWIQLAAYGRYKCKDIRAMLECLAWWCKELSTSQAVVQ